MAPETDRLPEIEQQRSELYDERGGPIFEHYLSVQDFEWLIAEVHSLRNGWHVNVLRIEELEAEVKRLRRLNQHQIFLIEQARDERDYSDRRLMDIVLILDAPHECNGCAGCKEDMYQALKLARGDD